MSRLNSTELQTHAEEKQDSGRLHVEYDEEEVRAVLMGMPQALRRGKWRVLAEKVGAR